MKLSITSNAVYGVRTDDKVQFLPEQGREGVFSVLRADAHRLDADNDLFVLVEYLHYILSGAEKPSRSMQTSRMFFARPMRAM